MPRLSVFGDTAGAGRRTVNQLKLGVLLCGLVGLVAVFLPHDSMGGHTVSLWDGHSQPTSQGGGLHVYMIVAGYVAAFVMGVLALVKPPMQRWQSFVALVAFVFVLAKFRHWLPVEIFKHAVGAKILGVTVYAGALVSAVSLLKPETAR